MRTCSKLIGVTLAVVAALSIAATSASANRLSVNEQNTETIYHPIRGIAAGKTIECNLTLLEHFRAQTFTKSGGIAVTDHRDRGSCSGGEVTVLSETLPWETEFVNFSGTLPSPSRMREALIKVAMKIRPTGEAVECLIGTTARNPAFGELLISSGEVTGFRLDETVGIPLGGGFLCSFAGNASVSGTAEVTNLARIHPLMIALT